MLHLDLPILPLTQSRRFWRFTYEAPRITSIFNNVPAYLSAIIVSDVQRLQLHNSLPWIRMQTHGSLQPLAAENGRPAGLSEKIRFGEAILSACTTSMAENSAEVWTVSSVEGEDVGGSIVPLVELDMLCLLLHGLMHAGRRRMARYLRLWMGGGAAALILWETDQEGRDQVRDATRTRDEAGNIYS